MLQHTVNKVQFLRDLQAVLSVFSAFGCGTKRGFKMTAFYLGFNFA
jgi:hypothetical protein